MKTKIAVALSLMFLIAIWHCPNANGQVGVSSASVGFAKTGSGSYNHHGQYMMPQPDFFRIEEFINYHRHDLPLPEGDKRVRLDVQSMKLNSEKSVLQFGITTPRALESDQIPPLNVVLIIDESGSMGGEKIENLKKSLRAFVERFRKSDRIAIVGFESSARVILPATEKTKVHKILTAIDSIRAGGGTNLHAGLMTGYGEALKNFDPERTNRVIFLTDGNANVGKVESSQIAAESKACIKKGISLVTIGLGVDFNNGLLREIADSGRGMMHFVGDAKDIEKTFVKEVDSLLAPAANNVRLVIELEQDKDLKVYGYDNHLKKGDGKWVLKLDDLNHGATQVVMARIPTKSLVKGGVVRLEYVDAIHREKVSLNVDCTKIQSADDPTDSIKRNYSIALLAKGLYSAAKVSHEGDSKKASRKLASAIKKAKQVWSLKDKPVKRIVKIVNEYEEKLDRSRSKFAGSKYDK